ncbi:MAG: TetR/AcrR family transcriptional regulator [Desulfobulbaceae bacterium]|nr:TetR/AcrR family transcriptional regulator [Desulfobulbaceae bacterium]
MKKKSLSANATFNNLPLEKQEAIIHETVREFAANGYQKASLNTIVKNLGIAKGSLYQYFRNKEAIFYFVFEEFTHRVKQTVKDGTGQERSADFFDRVKQVMLAAITFVDRYPDYFQIYLKVLFEHDVPRREELLGRVRLFSREYFGPLCEEAREKGVIRRDIPVATLIFLLDAFFDRFLQGYVQPYLDGGLGMAKMSRKELTVKIDEMIEVLRGGFVGEEAEKVKK